MILCAGFGTRLRPLTEELPKPLVPVGDRAALAHVLARVRDAPRVVVNAHHRPEEIAAFAKLHDALVSVEAQLLGTAGGVAHAATLLGDGDVVVWNGDILCELDPGVLARAHAGGAQATLVVRPGPTGSGNVGLDGEGRVVRLRAETTMKGEVRGGEFLGIHVIGKELRARLPERGCLVGDVYLPALRRGAVLRAFCTEVPFFDIGTLESYLAANLAWLRDGSAWLASSARVARSVGCERSVVGEEARVEGEGALVRCVVWPRATARAPLADAVVTPSRVVSVKA
jgi:mannose-1-phosphate guanylyltransferase